jgi:hypothetical protein
MHSLSNGLNKVSRRTRVYKHSPTYPHLIAMAPITLTPTSSPFLRVVIRLWSRRVRAPAAVMQGAPVPHILRPTSDDATYYFWGEAYVHGIMRGEAMTGDSTLFTLR